MSGKSGRFLPGADPRVVLEGHGSHALAFFRPVELIVATEPQEVAGALKRLDEVRRQGLHAAGYLSYELGYVLEPKLLPLLRADRPVPLLWFGVFERAKELDLDAAPENELLQENRAYAGPLRHEWDEKAYGARFRRVREYIRAGDIYQANLSFRSRFRFHGEPWAFYLALRRQAGSSHGAFIDDGERQILSASPELFFDLSPEGTLTARPMKGTMPRGADDAADLANRLSLPESDKNRAENLMIVDLLRNDVGRLARVGSVTVPELFAVETYPTLHQMVSTVTGQLEQDAPAEAVVRALFPCGSVTGAPKIRAIEIIRELEDSPRGVYCGAIGAFMGDGSTRFNVAIRTLTIAGGEGELGIGGGIVQDSRADEEYAECRLKARHYEQARRPIELIETLAYSPQEGFRLCREHLDRLSGSAQTLGLPCDRAAIEAAMETLVSDAAGALRVRVCLDESGKVAVTAAPLVPPEARDWRYVLSPRQVSTGDALLRHKSGWRELFDGEFARLSRALGCDEVLFRNELGQLTEGSRTNIFVQRDGKLFTPPACAGLLGGRLRHHLLAEGRCEEAVLYPEDLQGAEAVFLGNSLRGLIPARPIGLAPG